MRRGARAYTHPREAVLRALQCRARQPRSASLLPVAHLSLGGRTISQIPIATVATRSRRAASGRLDARALALGAYDVRSPFSTSLTSYASRPSRRAASAGRTPSRAASSPSAVQLVAGLHASRSAAHRVGTSRPAGRPLDTFGSWTRLYSSLGGDDLDLRDSPSCRSASWYRSSPRQVLRRRRRMTLNVVSPSSSGGMADQPSTTSRLVLGGRGNQGSTSRVRRERRREF